MAYIFLAVAILFEVVGTSALKFSEGFTKPLASTIVVIGYGVSFYLLSLSLKTLSVGFAYAMWSAVGIVLISLIGVYLFKEGVDLAGALGITLIISGVLVLNLFSKMSGH